jgi:hypothetical protein
MFDGPVSVTRELKPVEDAELVVVEVCAHA